MPLPTEQPAAGQRCPRPTPSPPWWPRRNASAGQARDDDGALLSRPKDPTAVAGEQPFALRQPIPAGHKLALRAIAAGEAVRRYGQAIGAARRAIRAGEHVHTHNVGAEAFERQAAWGVDARPVTTVPQGERRTFLGYRRAGGRVGTRNMIAVLSTVNCSAHAALEIAHHFTAERLAAFPSVDGVIALTQ